MKKFIIILHLFITSISYSQDMSVIDIIFEKKCAELNSTKTPVMWVKGIILDYQACGKDGAVMYEFSFINIDITDDSQIRQEFDMDNDGNIDFWYKTPDDIIFVKKGFEITATAPSLNSGWFEEFKANKSQIVFSAFDKNEKFLFVIIYDVGLNGEYQRNLSAEKLVENMFISAENIFEDLK